MVHCTVVLSRIHLIFDINSFHEFSLFSLRPLACLGKALHIYGCRSLFTAYIRFFGSQCMTMSLIPSVLLLSVLQCLAYFFSLAFTLSRNLTCTWMTYAQFDELSMMSSGYAGRVEIGMGKAAGSHILEHFVKV